MSAEEKNDHLLSGEEHQIRCQKVEALRNQSIDPWPESKAVNATCHDVHLEFEKEQESKVYDVAGRVMIKREHGKAMFVILQDRSGRVQVYIRQDAVGEKTYDTMKHMLDIGDFLWVTGQSFRTKMGEVSIKATDATLISKCLHPLPEKFHGIADIEIKYRQRYLDLISSAESRERFVKRAAIIRAMRNFFDKHEFMEVETPMLHPIPGGAAAKPFITHHNALDMQLYMRIAPELYLKRLVVGGFERVFEINRNFRNEGISTKHNPEFTMAEWYIAYKDYEWGMDFLEEMLRTIAITVCGSAQVSYGNETIDFSSCKRMTMAQAVIMYGKCTEKDLLPEKIDALCTKHGIKVTKEMLWGNKLALLFEELAEKHLIQPTFITQFPTEISPLAKRNPEHPDIADRFELFVAGMELSNGFNELNDPFDQAARFKAQAHARHEGDDEAHHFDAEYVSALEYGLPPTFGCGMGIDRLAMLLTNTQSIKDVILFPTLKRK